ncbi:Uncharacterised protein [Vibrio cholerae]|nr:Uncharacterised protein [Vibrio cholerae]CSI82774.1 Uncharacterised protein [Vibrio cholerae]
MLIRVSMTMPASTAVRLPTITSNHCAEGTSPISSATRSRTNPPMLTTPACNNAETGVGASIT